MTNHTTARQRLLRFPLILGVTTALIFSSCSTGTNNNSAPSDKGTVTSQSPRQVENATNVLQNVNIQMGRDGEVSSIESTNIYVNDKDRTSSSSNVQFKPKDVVNDLPVRVSLQYSTERGSGTNLNDLNGYSGEITIKVTVENLTVKTEDVTYDASGTSRTSPAPVGTPFSIAASTVLSGSPTQVITTPDAADSSTNGVVSTNDEGKAVVQWGAISAPPVTGSSSSFVLKVKAKDFSAPTFNISVQPGFASDLSGAGIITNGFTSQDASQVALLQRTIDTVNEVNTTLTSASSQVAQVRQSVNQMKETSSRLIESIKNVHSRAASARAELVDGSGSMSAQNKELAEQLCALSTERGGSLSAEQVEHLRGYLTASSCGGAASPSASPSSEAPSEAPSPAPSESASVAPSEEPSKKVEAPSAAPSSEAPSAEPTATEGNTRVITVENANERTYTSNTPAARTPMEQRIAAAVAAWDEVLAATSMDDPKEGLARDAKDLNDAVNAVDGALGEVEKTLNDAANAQNQDAEKKEEPTEEAKVSLRDRIHSASDAVNALGKNLEDMTNMQADLSTAIKEAFKESANETRESLTSMISEEIRKVSSDGSSSASAAKEAFSASVAGITDTANTVVQVAGESIEVQHKDMNDRIEGLRQSLDSVTERSLVALSTRAENATRDLAGASVQLNNDLSKLMLDLGDSNAEGAGLLGALKSNSAKAGAADYQLALAMQNAQGYTNLRSEDISALQKRQAQFKASLQRLRSLPTFHLSNAGSAEVKTVYTFQIGD